MSKPIMLPKKSAVRRVFLVIHLWLGVVIGLYFAVVGATGSVLVFRNEIDGLERPEMVSAAPPASGPRATLPLAAVVAGLHAAFPEAEPTDFTTVMMPHRRGGAYSVFFTGKGGPETLTVDPYDGHVLRRASGDSGFMAWVRDLHIHLLRKAAGETANGYASLFAAVLLLTGLYLWWPATVRLIKQALTTRQGVSLRRTLHDLHNVLGFYTLFILCVVTLTGTALVFNEQVQTAVYRLVGAPARAKIRPIAPEPGAPRVPIDTLLAAAQSAVPDGTVTFITMPTRRGQPFYAMFDTTRNRFLPYASVYVDPYSGRVQRVQRDDESSPAQIIMRQMAVLHFGEWGGLAAKILYALVGLTPLALWVTGLWMYLLKRVRRASAARTRRLSAAQITMPAID